MAEEENYRERKIARTIQISDSASVDIGVCRGRLSVGMLGRLPIPDQIAMAFSAPNNGMVLVSRLLWFPATNHQLA